MTYKELNEIAKKLWDAKMATDDRLEGIAIEAGIAAICKMRDRQDRPDNI